MIKVSHTCVSAMPILNCEKELTASKAYNRKQINERYTVSIHVVCQRCLHPNECQLIAFPWGKSGLI